MDASEVLFGSVFKFCQENELKDVWGAACLELIRRKVVRLASYINMRTLLQVVEAVKDVG